jgi:putative glutamine amidotransferase
MPMLPGHGVSPKNISKYSPSREGVRGWWTLIAQGGIHLKKPVIGISCNQRLVPGEIFLKTEYVAAIIKNGGLPILIPVNQDEELIDDWVTVCQGLLLTGGGDIDPAFYGREMLPRVNLNIDQERDRFEIGLAQRALNIKMPILAICRGIQVLNVCLHGTLFQDINLELPDSGVHQADSMSKPAFHPVFFKKNTRIEKLLGDQALVNSTHHQAINNPGNGLIISGTSPDGIVESVEGGKDSWIIGVQWHPERMAETDSMRALFGELIGAANRFQPLDRSSSFM